MGSRSGKVKKSRADSRKDSGSVKKEEVQARIEEIGIVPAVRLSSAEDARFATEAVSHGGIPIVEITMTVPRAIEVISDLARNSPGLILGAGTFFDFKTAQPRLGSAATVLHPPPPHPRITKFAP